MIADCFNGLPQDEPVIQFRIQEVSTRIYALKHTLHNIPLRLEDPISRRIGNGLIYHFALPPLQFGRRFCQYSNTPVLQYSLGAAITKSG